VGGCDVAALARKNYWLQTAYESTSDAVLVQIPIQESSLIQKAVVIVGGAMCSTRASADN